MPITKTDLPIILASASPWRKRLLSRHGVFCRIHVSHFSESFIGSPRDIVLYNACGKAEKVLRETVAQKAIIIGVDTVGVFQRKILGKPKNRRAAKVMLRALSGKTHRVITGLCVINTATRKKKTAVATTKITFRKIMQSELDEYLDSGQWKGKAGSYAIQGRAKKFVKKIDGDITNVIGVPMEELKKILKEI